MKGKILFIILLNFIYSDAFSACLYEQKINKCTDAQKGQTHRELLDSDDILCISDTEENRIYQIVLDERFQKIDKEIEEEYIANLEKNKGYYFGKDREKSYLDAIDNITAIYRKDGRFGSQYYEVCTGLQQDVIDCSPPSAEIANAKDFYGATSTICTELADKKLEIYKQVSLDILLLNKLQVSKDEKKIYVQEERMKYDDVLTKFMVNLGYVERIWAKWPSKIKNTSGGG